MFNNYYLPGDLEQQIGTFAEHYNHIHHNKSIDT